MGNFENNGYSRISRKGTKVTLGQLQCSIHLLGNIGERNSLEGLDSFLDSFIEDSINLYLLLIIVVSTLSPLFLVVHFTENHQNKKEKDEK